ncbi:hypothetical protein M3225_26705 [Priestia aryabhattai]|uniref:hypothetical protein n=1 Tax=Priestia aryabhattai TaxID=412384 RepID=UPI00203ECC98|nr:hypothetical protein [Priestia aryabhattai]MCM3774010.1 hypothetical protein [Priestia aryabhattai]
MFLKRVVVMASLLSISILLAACEEKKITYQETKMTVSEAEERIADQLEVENPDDDLEVSISEESDD